MVAAAVVLALGAVVPQALADKPATGQAKAGVGVADATWNVGSNAGQYGTSRDVGGVAQLLVGTRA